LEVSDLTDKEGAFSHVNLHLRKGETLGLYGLVGAGRSEFAQAIFGIHDYSEGQVLLKDHLLPKGTPQGAVNQGIAYLPEDRLTQGIFRDLTVRENAVMAVLRRLCRWGFVSSGKEQATTQRIITQTHVKTDGVEVAVETLSGGNQQKVVLGRWLETAPEVLLLDEPTRGVDVGAKAEIHKLVADLSASGKGILLISSDLPEVMAMSDRVAVMSEGKIVAEFDPRQDPAEKVATAAFPVGNHHSQEQELASGSTQATYFDLSLFREVGIGLALVLVMGVLAFLKPQEFISFSNLSDVLSSISILSVLALGTTFVIGGGGIDISIGSMLGLVGACAGLLAVNSVPVPVCLLLAIGLGALLGLVNMGISLLGRIHPIIVTLAGLSIYRGLMRQLTGGYEVTNIPDSYRALADGFLLGVPRVVWFALLILVVAWALLQRSTWGRQILAVGNSRTAASQIGLPTERLLLLSFALSGALVGLASVLWGAYYGKLQSSAGEGLELQAIAAAVIGGCNIMGGSGTAIGTFLGACLIGVINNGLTLLKISTYWQPVFVGAFILATVLVDRWVIFGTRRKSR
jgi:ribose/xylose/arabinose/galactoside ABC-type transport system permease subunit/ABC-type multidrug transport system ATPase subunit